MIREQSFLGEGDENPNSHLREFEQICACLFIAGMSDETLIWKLFSFSLIGRAKRWYRQTVGSMQGDWKTLCSKFCLVFFPISRIVRLRFEVLSFKQKEQESLGTSWACFNDLITTSLDHAIQDPVLLQHFYMGLNKDSMNFLDMTSRGAFLHLSASKARTILDKIIRHISYTSIYDDLLEKEKKASPDQEEEALIAKSQPFQSQDLAINSKPSIPQNPPGKEEIPPLEIPFETKNDLFMLILGKT
jgi:hypothetical protein